MADMIEEMEADADALVASGEYGHALAQYSVLREIRARREGPYSMKYLKNLHSCVRCMHELSLWSDADPLCRELYGKYVRTHGPAQADTVDVAKLWAWARVNLDELPAAVELYLRTADAVWDGDQPTARRLLGAVAVHHGEFDPEPLIDTVALTHTFEVVAALSDLISSVVAQPERARAALTVDGLTW